MLSISLYVLLQSSIHKILLVIWLSKLNFQISKKFGVLLMRIMTLSKTTIDNKSYGLTIDRFFDLNANRCKLIWFLCRNSPFDTANFENIFFFGIIVKKNKLFEIIKNCEQKCNQICIKIRFKFSITNRNCGELCEWVALVLHSHTYTYTYIHIQYWQFKYFKIHISHKAYKLTSVSTFEIWHFSVNLQIISTCFSHSFSQSF